MLKKSSFQNVPLQWLSLGEGPALVLLHGFTETHEAWAATAEALASDYRVLVPDLPGSGGTGLAGDSSADMAFMADCIWAMLAAENIDQAVLVGHSMGGYVALEMLAQLPERVLGLGLVHSHPLGDDEGKKANRDRTVALIESRGSKHFLHGFIPSLFAEGNRKRLARLISKLESQAAEQSVLAYVAQTKGMRDRRERLTLLQSSVLPKLVVLGSGDPILPQSVGLSFAAQLDNCQLELLPEAGHMGMYECPEKMVEILREFLIFVNLKH
jgi:pimeloyl-ACP methyl ester carboxylesterase